MTLRPNLGEMLLGIEGLALLRLAANGDTAERRARVDEIRALIRQIDAPELTGTTGTEYDVSDGYRLWSETYDGPLRLSPLETPIMHRLFDALAPSVVLDAACGTGRHSASLAQRGHRIIGVDLSPEMLHRARANGVAGRYLEGSFTALPLRADAVDAAVCALAMVHLPDVSDAARELARVVRPGGRVMPSDVHPLVILLGWQAQYRTASGQAGFMRIHPHHPSDFWQAFAAAGLHVRGCYEPRLTV